MLDVLSRYRSFRAAPPVAFCCSWVNRRLRRLADASFKRVPALMSILSARIIPASGGETEFVSTRLAFERFEPDLREQLENSFAWHDYAHSRGQIARTLQAPRNGRP